MYLLMIHTLMIQSAKGKLAASALKGKYGKGFPGDLVKRTRAMLTVHRICSSARAMVMRFIAKVA